MRKLAFAELLDAVNVNVIEALLLDMSRAVVICQVLLLSAGLGSDCVSLLEEVDAAWILIRRGGSMVDAVQWWHEQWKEEEIRG